MPDRNRAKLIVREILKQAGGSLERTSHVYKTFYLAHLFYYVSDSSGYLSNWPIVHMPHGPGIHNGDSLLRELARAGQIQTEEILIGPYQSEKYVLLDEGNTGLDEAEIKAIRQALSFVQTKDSSELSEFMHEFSRSWNQTKNGEELDIYSDLLKGGQHKKAMAAAQKERQIV